MGKAWKSGFQKLLESEGSKTLWVKWFFGSSCYGTWGLGRSGKEVPNNPRKELCHCQGEALNECSLSNRG